MNITNLASSLHFVFLISQDQISDWLRVLLWCCGPVWCPTQILFLLISLLLPLVISPLNHETYLSTPSSPSPSPPNSTDRAHYEPGAAQGFGLLVYEMTSVVIWHDINKMEYA